MIQNQPIRNTPLDLVVINDCKSVIHPPRASGLLWKDGLKQKYSQLCLSQIHWEFGTEEKLSIRVNLTYVG